jgi:hypothetical protein
VSIEEVPFEIISRVNNTFDCCIGQNEVTLVTENGRLWNAIKDLKKRGIRVRFVTTVNEGNIKKVGEVFHNNAVKGAFQIVDGGNYLCYITENEDKILGSKNRTTNCSIVSFIPSPLTPFKPHH